MLPLHSPMRESSTSPFTSVELTQSARSLQRSWWLNPLGLSPGATAQLQLILPRTEISPCYLTRCIPMSSLRPTLLCKCQSQPGRQLQRESFSAHCAKPCRGQSPPERQLQLDSFLASCAKRTRVITALDLGMRQDSGPVSKNSRV